MIKNLHSFLIYLWSIKKQSDVIAFREECCHFHRGKVITSTRDNILIMFQTSNENKITNTNLCDIMMIVPENQVSLKSPISTSVSPSNSIDIKALSLNIVLLRLKKTYINKLNVLMSSPSFNAEERQCDIDFLSKNIFTIDRYLKNVLLKLRLRFEKDFGKLKRH